MIDELVAASEAGQYLYAAPEFRDAALSEADVPAARAAVEALPDATRYHLLMALRRDAPDVYAGIDPAVRASVLAAALGHVQFLNDFGYLAPGGSHDGESAAALLETGEAAIAALRPLLDDERPAPSRGSEAATVARIHGVRRCDYAYRYLTLLTGGVPEFVGDAPERDAAISALRSRLA